MTTRSIIFDGREVRNTLAGNKTRFSRVVKPQPSDEWSGASCSWYYPTRIDRNGEEYPGPEVFGFADGEEGWVCPFGGPGDLLIVKEGLCRSESGVAAYKADHVPVVVDGEPETWRWQCKSLSPAGMPPRASRLTLRVADVRVKRITAVSENDPWMWATEFEVVI